MATVYGRISDARQFDEEQRMPRSTGRETWGNYRTTALISHASEVPVGVLQNRLELFLILRLPIDLADFRKGRGMREHIANLGWMMERDTEHRRRGNTIHYGGYTVYRNYQSSWFRSRGCVGKHSV